MGRLKSWQHLSPLFSGKYKKLLEEFGSNKDYSKLLLEDFISYNCGHCGHIQKLQAEELNSILNHAFRLAYTSHLQKSNDCSNTDLKFSKHSSVSSGDFKIVSNLSHHPQSVLSSNSGHLINCNSNLTTKTISQRSSTHLQSCSESVPPSILEKSSKSSSCGDSQSLSDNNCKICITSNHSHPGLSCSFGDHSQNSQSTESNTTNSISSVETPFLPSQQHSSSQFSDIPNSENSSMRTPNLSSGVVSAGINGGFCTVRKPPSDLPGLRLLDHENNNSCNNNNTFHSPDSENSNSPTELNTTRCLGDKPPLVKNVNLSVDLDEEKKLFSRELSTRSGRISSSKRKNSNSSPFGYVNEKKSERSRDNNNCLSINKNVMNDAIDLKVLAQNSLNSEVPSVGSEFELSQRNIPRNNPQPPPIPERFDSLALPEDLQLKSAAWFQAGIPREIALEVLSKEPVGAFMVRESTSKPGCFALSLRVPRDFTVSGIAHYLIVKTNKGYKIKGFTKEFITLTALITHHSVMPELLPCPLLLSLYQPTFSTGSQSQNEDSEDEDDPDYSTLSNFRKMMAELDI